MVLALVDHITPRHRYIFEFLFRDILGLDISLTDNRDEFAGFAGAKFSYVEDIQDDGINFYPAGLLSEKGLHPSLKDSIPPPGTSSLPQGLHSLTHLFPVKAGGNLSFDPFSAAFFILTRMEEYLADAWDAHGRFSEKQSFQYIAGLMHEPVVNLLAFEVVDILRRKYPGLVPFVHYSFLPTIDVDIAFAHKGKQLWRAMGGYAKLILKGDLSRLKERWRVVHGHLPDPYDNFDLHLEHAERHGTGLIYFLLLGDYGKYDKMISYRNPAFRELIRKVSGEAETGIHPSYTSFGNMDKVRAEKERLEEITGNPVTKHRAHFLRIRFPDTFRDLIRLGITDDYSLGYSTVNGFRAGTATPFYFYDLLKDDVTSLKVHPFIFMDSAMADNLKLNAGDAEGEAKELVDKVKRWGGEAVGVWHNYVLSDKDHYHGYRQFFENMMDYSTNG